MGYESRLIFVHKSNLTLNSNNRQFAEVICTLDMCKLGGRPKCFDKETDCFFYLPGDGNKMVLKDRYNDPITECSLRDCFNHFIKEESNTRISLALHIMTTFIGHGIEKQVTVLHYGY